MSVHHGTLGICEKLLLGERNQGDGAAISGSIWQIVATVGVTASVKISPSSSWDRHENGDSAGGAEGRQDRQILVEPARPSTEDDVVALMETA